MYSATYNPLLVVEDVSAEKTSIIQAQFFSPRNQVLPWRQGQCCSFVFVGEGGQLTDTGTTALLQFSNSVFPNIGGSFVNVTDSAGLADSVSRPALLSPAGPLLQDLGGRYTINGAVLRIRNGSEVDSKSANPLLSFSNSAVNAPLNGNMSLLNQGSINAAVAVR